MAKKLSEVIKPLLDTAMAEVKANGTSVPQETGVFKSGPSSIPMNSSNNTAQSVQAKFQTVMNEAYSIGSAQLQFLEGCYRAEKKAIDSTSEGTVIEEQHKELEDRFKFLEAEWKETARRVGRTVPIIKFPSKIAYFALLVFIGICEIPLNMVIFQRFGESNTVTMIMAGTVAIAVPVLAHFIGMYWRWRSENKAYASAAVVLTVLFLATNFGLGLFRADVLSDVISGSGAEVTDYDTYLNVEIFVGLTTILFFIGVVAAYFRHDPSYSLEHTYAQYKRKKGEYDESRLNLAESVLESKRKREAKLDEAIRDYNKYLGDAIGAEKIVQSTYAMTASEVGLEVGTLETYIEGTPTIEYLNHTTDVG